MQTRPCRACHLSRTTMQATPLLHMPASPHRWCMVGNPEPMHQATINWPLHWLLPTPKPPLLETPPRPPAATVPSPDSFLGATPSRVWGVRMIFRRHGRAIVLNFSFVGDMVSCSFSPLSFPSRSLSFNICRVSKGGLTLTQDTNEPPTSSIRHRHRQPLRNRLETVYLENAANMI